MSSINKIKKIQYHKKTTDIINLVEYIVFQNDIKKKKQIVFKFHNNMNQNISSFQFEVSQYNNENLLIEKSVVEYDKLMENSRNNDFVPESRLNVNYECARIECHLIKAIFERVIWENGVYSPIPYTLDDFRNSSQKTETPKKEALPKKTNKKEKIIHNDIKIKNVTRLNIPNGHLVYLTLASVFLVVLMVVGSILFKISSTEYYDGTFQYSVNKENNTCIITGYESNDREVVIPNQINRKYTVVGIGEKAFKNSNVTKVTIDAYNLTIGNDAFSGSKKLVEFIPNDEESILVLGQGVFGNCTSLKRVELNNVANIFAYTFYNCKNLEELIVPSSILYREALNGCTKLKYVEYDKTNTLTTFRDLFGETDINVESIKTNMAVISSDYFGSIPTLTKIDFTNPNPTIEFGAFYGLNLDGYYGNESIEYVSGEVLISPSATEFIISDFPEEILDLVFDKISNYCKTLIIDNSSMTITNYQIAQLYKLEKVIIKNCNSVEWNAFDVANNLIMEANTSMLSKIKGNSSVTDLIITEMNSNFNKNCLGGFPNLVRVEMPFTEDTLSYLGLTRNIREIVYTKCQGNILPSYYLDGYYNVEELVLPEGIVSTSMYAITNCSSLRRLSLPKSIEKMAEHVIGKECYNLYDVTLPFVGTTSTDGLPYSDVNLSSSATLYLKVLGKTYGGEAFSIGLEGAMAIDFEGIVTETKNLLQNCYNLRSVKFTNNKVITDIVTERQIELDWLFLDNVGKVDCNSDLLIIKNIWMNSINPFSSLNAVALKNYGTRIYITKNEKIDYENVTYNYSLTYDEIIKK